MASSATLRICRSGLKPRHTHAAIGAKNGSAWPMR